VHVGGWRGPVRVEGGVHRAADVGDEPLLLAAFAPVWVGRDRVAAARAAVAAGAQAILLDDGLQNPGLAKDVAIVVVDAATGFGNGRVAPAGPLREPVAAGLARADLVLALGEPVDRTRLLHDWPELAARPVVAGRLAPLATGMPWRGLRAVAFAGIGRPEKFFATLRAQGAELVAAHGFPDHMPYATRLLQRMEAEARAARAQLVTTEKDAVRLPPRLPHPRPYPARPAGGRRLDPNRSGARPYPRRGRSRRHLGAKRVCWARAGGSRSGHRPAGLGETMAIAQRNSRLVGTPGNDVLAATADRQLVLGLGGHDTLTSTFNRTTLRGGSGNDQLTTTLDAAGISEADLEARQFGGDGADELTIETETRGPGGLVGGPPPEGGQIRNVADGGNGDDLIDVSGVFTFGGVVRNIISGGAGDDVIYATADMGDFGSRGVNRIEGGSGIDIIVVEAVNGFDFPGAETRNVVNSGSGSDAVIAFASTTGGGHSENLVHAGGGHDYIEVTTFSGSDVGSSTATNRVYGGDGHDRISAIQSSSGEDGSVIYSTLLDGGDGNDSLTADSESISEVDPSGYGFATLENVLIGGTGDDELTARAIARGYETMSALNRLSGGSGDDRLDAAAFASTVSGENSSSQNILEGGSGDDVLIGETFHFFATSDHSSQLFGGTGHDQLTVFGGSDNLLVGGSGNDSLAGGSGDDDLLGGADADTFVFNLARDQGTDRLGNFERALDRLAFSRIADAGAPGLADDLDAVSTVTDAGAGQDVTVDFTVGTTLVFANLGTGSVDSIADLVDDPLNQLLIA